MFICLYIDFWWASSKIQQHYVRLHPVAEEQKDKKGKGCCFYILGRTALGGVVWGWGTFEYPCMSEMGEKTTMKNITWIILTLMSPLFITKQTSERSWFQLLNTGIKILNFTDIPRNETWQITINNSPMSHRQGHSCRCFFGYSVSPSRGHIFWRAHCYLPKICLPKPSQSSRMNTWRDFFRATTGGTVDRISFNFRSSTRGTRKNWSPIVFWGVYRAWKKAHLVIDNRVWNRDLLWVFSVINLI